ncbi:hypothetical protein [Nostoc sp. UHCC 0870]|uniref:hypothetical protein n=1 Tax=Nostoc sp. UHCC 0870 TaxID=2914041 RepID=UPI001EDEA4E8|nr:hypothetical protein [Nostoc sp. UHCC 0870]UKO97786.1 hypothetical protein L6494_25020 [Nostoc sp. UHCC 0870]
MKTLPTRLPQGARAFNPRIRLAALSSPYTPTPLHPYTPTTLHPYTPTPLHPP